VEDELPIARPSLPRTAKIVNKSDSFDICWRSGAILAAPWAEDIEQNSDHLTDW